jgi:hypothetical protein
VSAVVRSLAPRDVTADRSALLDLARKHFVFDAYVAGEPRVSAEPLVLSRQAHEAAVATAQDAYAAIAAVAATSFTDEREGDRYGLSPEIRGLVEASHGANERASLCRVDLLHRADGGFTACELNSDCPGGQNEVEALPAMAIARGFDEGHSPSRVVAAMADRMASLARENGGETVALLFATAYAEDLQVAATVARALRQRGLRTILAPPTSPRLVGERLCVRGQPVDVLYRFFPTEGMAGQANVDDLSRAVASGRVRSFSAFSSLPTQSKLAMARAYEIDAASSDARARLERSVPPTFTLGRYLRAELLADRAGWVLKRDFGRVGDQVFVGSLLRDEEWQTVVDEALSYVATLQEIWIAQRFVPQATIETPWGRRFLTLGAYLLDGEFVGYFARLTEVSHVSHDALAVPVFVEGAA